VTPTGLSDDGGADSAAPRAAAAGGGGDGPAVLETHVSVLVFFEDVVLKYKKPQRFPFADFTTRPARLDACRAEVEANSRLSPDVYVGVADVVVHGRVLDHAVVMRRLPADRSLAALAAAHAPRLHADLAQVARLLAGFHERAPRSAAIDADAEVEALRRTWGACLDELARHAGRLLPEATVRRVGELAVGYLAGRGALFARRVAERRICDGHGDLLATDVFVLDDGPRVLDCVEFDPRLRHVDVIADVAFLAMDLERLGAPDAAAAFLGRYQQDAGERFAPTLLHHYIAQRAVVRAEVACLRAEQTGAARCDPAVALLGLALEHLRAARVVLGVVCGLPGTGKSTVARAVGERLGWPVLRSDDIRRELVGAGGPGPVVEPWRTGAYAPEMTQRTYAVLLARATQALELGQPVLLDATFASGAHRRAVADVARATASDLVVFECSAPTPVADRRLRARAVAGTDVSGADEAVAHAMAPTAVPWPGALRVDTGARPLPDCVRAVVETLQADGDLSVRSPQR